MSELAPIGRPTDAAMWASVAVTLRGAVLPAIEDPHTRQLVVQLVGLATYARDRGRDPTAERVAALADALDVLTLDSNPIVADRWTGAHGRDAQTVMAVCADVLAAALDADETSRREVHARLRRLMLDQLETDLASEEVLLGAFRGRLADG
jgi:hypothetical protein